MTEDFLPANIQKTAFFTGHRQLTSADRNRISEHLHQCILEAYQHGYRRFFCGCARGFDTLAAFETIHIRKDHPDLILSLAVPCRTQADHWPEADRKSYQSILQSADDVMILSPFYYDGVMLSRNRYMADRSSLCICYWNQSRGGTSYTVRYAMQSGIARIINLAVEPACHFFT